MHSLSQKRSYEELCHFFVFEQVLENGVVDWICYQHFFLFVVNI